MLEAKAIKETTNSGHAAMSARGGSRSDSIQPLGFNPCGEAKVEKGGWRMPRLSQAMKDVISCEKPRGGASDP